MRNKADIGKRSESLRSRDGIGKAVMREVGLGSGRIYGFDAWEGRGFSDWQGTLKRSARGWGTYWSRGGY